MKRCIYLRIIFRNASILGMVISCVAIRKESIYWFEGVGKEKVTQGNKEGSSITWTFIPTRSKPI